MHTALNDLARTSQRQAIIVTAPANAFRQDAGFEQAIVVKRKFGTRCRNDARRTVSARLETKDLAPGSYTGSIEFESNGGRTSVVVQAQVTSPAGPRARLTRLLGR